MNVDWHCRIQGWQGGVRRGLVTNGVCPYDTIVVPSSCWADGSEPAKPLGFIKAFQAEYKTGFKSHCATASLGGAA